MTSPASSLTSSTSALSAMDVEFPLLSTPPSPPPRVLTDLPAEFLRKIFSFCDHPSLSAVSVVCADLASAVDSYRMSPEYDPSEEEGAVLLEGLPSEVLLHVFKLLDRQSLGRVAQVCHRFRQLAYAECLWLPSARSCLAANAADAAFVARAAAPLSSRDAVRISANWRQARYAETKLLVQNLRFMPRLQLERELLWVSWGNRIWAHPRNKEDGTIARTTTRALKGHTDDVSRFVVKDGLLVSGGRDATLLGWSADGGEFLFAKRYCHGGELSAVDVDARRGSSGVVVTGSRDRTVKVWSLATLENNSGGCNDNNNASRSASAASGFPEQSGCIDLGDRVWSLACDPFGGHRVAVGSAGLGGVPALHMLDLFRLDAVAPLGERVLKKGAGVLDIQWHGRDTFLSCGYDTFARMWDVRCGRCVRAWEEPFDESVYCFSTDGHVTMVTGTARHGLARLWDLRHQQPVSMYYARHAHHGQSSPVYSIAFDQSNLYVALDQCLNLLSFDDDVARSGDDNGGGGGGRSHHGHHHSYYHHHHHAPDQTRIKEQQQQRRYRHGRRFRRF